jgi:hypothetical protein
VSRPRSQHPADRRDVEQAIGRSARVSRSPSLPARQCQTLA